MPRFKLLSADAWVLTGPQRDRPEPGEGRKEYAGGAAATTSNREDGRDLLEAYPAPVDDKYSPDVFPMYVWSPSRQAALVLDTSGKLAWDARVPAKTVTNFGKTPSLTVWKLKKR